MKKLIKPVSKILNFLLKFRFPYRHKLFYKGGEAVFEIRNRTEEFRVKKWGGEEKYTKYILDHIKTKDVIFDIGASVGLVTVLAATKAKKGCVFSFEPDREVYEALNRNILINKLNNCFTHRVAISNRNGKAKLFSDGLNNSSPSMRPVQGFSKHNFVNTVKLDSFVREKGIKHINLIKIDVEGAEFEVLKGMCEVLKSKKSPVSLFIEVHPEFLGDFGSSKEVVIQYIKDHGYRIRKKIIRFEQELYHFEKTTI